MEFIAQFMDVILHLDVHLNNLVSAFGPWIYLILFLIIFCETGLVVTPFLPGDSLLFAVGALAATENAAMDIKVLLVLLFIAAVIGDAVNYLTGKHIGPRIFYSDTGRWLNKRHLQKTQAFYEKHGGKTIIIARFAPIIRTFAPFVAGIGRMDYSRFAMFNVAGAFLWIVSFLLAGYFFGNIPAVKDNFHIVIVAIIVISLMPLVVEYAKSRRSPAANQ